LKRGPELLEDFVLSFGDRPLGRARRKGLWSVIQHLEHLVEVQQVLLDRIRLFKTVDHPVITVYNPPEEEIDDSERPLEIIQDLLKEFRALRKEQIVELVDLPEEAFHKEASHPEFEYYSLAVLTRHIAIHDQWHMYRMEELALLRDAYLYM
jgi:hypothetical protein